MVRGVWIGLLCVAVTAWGDSPVGTPEWNLKMKELSEILPALQGDLASGVLDPDKKKGVLKRLDRLSELAHTVKEIVPGSPQWDPSFRFLSGTLERDAKRGKEAIEQGHWDYGRKLVLGLGRYCISCHTRDGSGPQFVDGVMKGAEGKLGPMEMAELAAALRQFDRALEAFEKVALDPKAVAERRFEWERAVKYALAILVRFQKNPEGTLKFVKALEGLPNLPGYFRDYVTGWRRSAESWKKEAAKIPTSEQGMWNWAKGLQVAARKHQRYPADHSADIDYLRLTALVHTLLEKYPKTDRAPEAMLLAGQAYESIDYPGVWLLNENYYEGCIRARPHGPLAETCYRKYEEAVVLGYSGSSGTHVPAAVQKHLDELRSLAAPKDKG